MLLAIGQFFPGSTNSLWAAHQVDLEYDHLGRRNAWQTLLHDADKIPRDDGVHNPKYLVSLPVARPCCSGLAGVGLVAEIPVVVAVAVEASLGDIICSASAPFRFAQLSTVLVGAVHATSVVCLDHFVRPEWWKRNQAAMRCSHLCSTAACSVFRVTNIETQEWRWVCLYSTALSTGLTY